MTIPEFELLYMEGQPLEWLLKEGQNALVEREGGMHWLKGKWWVGLIVLGLVMLAPLSVAAATNTEIIAILNAGIDGLVRLVKLAYCASGVAALCS